MQFRMGEGTPAVFFSLSLSSLFLFLLVLNRAFDVHAIVFCV